MRAKNRPNSAKSSVTPCAAVIVHRSAAVKSHINASNDASARDRRGMRECRTRLL